MCDSVPFKNEVCELAEVYVLGTCSPDEKVRFERHLSDCARCQLTVAHTADAISRLAPPRSPDPAVRRSLWDSIRQRDSAGDQDPSIVFEGVGVIARSADKMDWEPGPLPGTWTKNLFLDQKRGYHTSLVKLAPGTRYPAHRHAGVEEVFVLAGDLHLREGVITTGDYCRAEPNSVHSPSYTEAGCVLLITSSTSDELLASS